MILLKSWITISGLTEAGLTTSTSDLAAVTPIYYAHHRKDQAGHWPEPVKN